jgi:cell fate regulator YaaT (PSP1 superfamily)
MDIEENENIEQTNQDDKEITSQEESQQAEKTIKIQKSKIEVEQDSIGEDKIFLADQFTHPYFDEDPSVGRNHYEEPFTLSRGCSSMPQSYKTINKEELNSCEKLHVTNWMENIKPPSAQGYFDYVEVRFKNSHKDFYKIPDGLEITEGDIVAVEGTPGHDIGIVSLTGELCRIQMKKKKNFNLDNVKKLYRRAKASDIDKWLEVMKKEDNTLFDTRKMALKENLAMKINDVEYQGDGTKAIFYYTADDRVDFRQLIKYLAEAFRIRIEMKQIGARQEASRLGGIGTCGRELCCSTWLNNFTSVSTSVAKVQQLFPNPQKLAGQCGKLKCCLNYEYDVYQDALKDFPEIGVDIETVKGRAFYHKTDVLKRLMWYSYKDSSELIPIKVSDVKKMISMNKNNKRVEDIENYKVEITENKEQDINEQKYN